jgi:Rha family phage regulatory protein
MNNLINITNQEGSLVVNSREVADNFEKEHKHVMESIRNLMVEDSAVKDMIIESSYINTRGQEYPEYLLTRDGFSLLVMGFTGQRALSWKLKYIEAFNKMEKVIKTQVIPSNLSPQLQLLINMELKQKELEVAVTETKEEMQALRDAIVINPKAEWRKQTNNTLVTVGKNIGDYSRPRNDVYEALKERANCRPNVLVNNLKKRALENGMAPSKADKLNILDVLENDPRLREIYITIVKEMAIKHNVA